MISETRVQAVFNGKKPDRVPVFSFVGAYAATLAGIPLYEYYTNPGLAIELQLKARDLFGYDDGTHYGWADWGGWEFGGEIAFPKTRKEASPRTSANVINHVSQVDSLPVPDPVSAGMLPLIDKYNRQKIAMGEKAVIQGGSISLLAAGILGKTRLLRWYLREPSAVKVIYDKAADFVIAAARATIDRYGAVNCSVGFTAPMDTNDLISADIFHKFCFPVQARVNREIMQMGVDKFSIHLCGNHKHNLKLWAALPWPKRMLISLGPETDLVLAAETFGHRHVIAGNVSTSFLAYGSYEEVYNNTVQCIETGKDLPGGFIVMSGCEMPVLAPPLNVFAMVQAAKDVGGYV